MSCITNVPLDHKRFDVVNGMDVLHAVGDHLAHGLQALEASHGRDGVALHHHVAICEELEGLPQCTGSATRFMIQYAVVHVCGF